MTDLEIAKKELDGHSICLCKNGFFFTDDARGISPMMNYIAQGKDLNGYCVADVIVGKAAAILFVKAGIIQVHGKVMSEAGKLFLDRYNISNSFDALTDYIINRKETDICPMERAVMQIDDIELGYKALMEKIIELSKHS